MNELALFAGAGGGILGGKLLGWRTVCAVEINTYCARRIMQRQNEGHLPPFPLWDDVCTFDGHPWRGLVDVVSGGFPCQDIAAAGPATGIEGERSGLWKHIPRILVETDAPLSLSSKTARCSLDEDLERSCTIWPKSGTMRSGACSEVPMLGLGTKGNASGFSLPTIGATEYKGSSKVRYRNSSEYRGAKMSEGLRISELDPTYTDPNFAEVAMGWPIMWTASTPLETDKFRSWLQLHLKS